MSSVDQQDFLFKKVTDVALTGKRVFIRADLNVPHNEFHEITDETRINAVLPTIELVLKSGAAVMVCSHLGRPKEGASLKDHESLDAVAEALSKKLGRHVPLVRDWIYGVSVEPGEIVLLENCRSLIGEKTNSSDLGQKIAQLCDVYINDAFAVSHRSEATISAVASYAPVVCAGLLMMKELEALSQIVQSPKKPFAAVVGGSKMETKLKIIQSLAEWVDILIVGGGIANTFLLAKGQPIGSSLVSPTLLGEAKQILNRMEERGALLPLPIDVVVARELSSSSLALTKNIADVDYGDMILDVGPQTIAEFSNVLSQAATIVWNGPLGVFEYDAFSQGTVSIAHIISQSKAFSVAGGGETNAAIEKAQVSDSIDYISTGGGAFLAFLEGKKLPGVEALMRGGCE